MKKFACTFIKFSQNILGTYMYLLYIKFSKKFLQWINSELKKKNYTFCNGQKLRNAVELE